MKLLNAQYRGVKKVTDVLSFPLIDSDLKNIGIVHPHPHPHPSRGRGQRETSLSRGRELMIYSDKYPPSTCGRGLGGGGTELLPNTLGDIVICIPQALSQTKDYGVTFYDELLRLLLHGLLHLLGYDHEINTYQKRKMEKKERELLNAIKAMA